MSHASGTFDVKMTPQGADEKSDPSIARFLFDKQFHGDLDGSSKGQMLSSGNPSKGFGGYVAIEQVTGTLKGRTGSFALQHSGTLDNGATNLSVQVVPGSGAGQLAGLSGTLNIKITEGKHFYEFEYSLPDAH